MQLAALASLRTHVAFRREFGFFEIAKNLLRAFQNFLRHASESRDLDAVAFVRAACDNLAQEHDLVVPFAHGDVEIFQSRQSRLEFGQLVIMRGKQRLCADLVVQVLDDAPRERKAVKGAGAAPNFIHQH